MTDDDLAEWEPRVLEDLARGPGVYAYPGLMGAVCERLVARGLVTKAPAGFMQTPTRKGFKDDKDHPQFRYELVRPKFAPLPTVDGGFRCVLADPPWSFRSYDKRELVPTQGEQPYATMSLDDIKALPVAEVCAKDCMLILWTVSHLQDEAAEVARAWGFTPKSLGPVWVKEGGLGMGYYFRQEVEITRLCTRGKPKRLSKGVRQVIRAPRQAHSQKPEAQYGRIEALCEGPYLELFARPTRRRRHWAYWGNELDRFTQGGEAARLRHSED